MNDTNHTNHDDTDLDARLDALTNRIAAAEAKIRQAVDSGLLHLTNGSHPPPNDDVTIAIKGYRYGE
jgi:hypothetical protein